MIPVIQAFYDKLKNAFDNFILLLSYLAFVLSIFRTCLFAYSHAYSFSDICQLF